MRRLITLALVCLTFALAPLAYSAPGTGILATQYRSYLEGAYGSVEQGGVQTVFWGFVYDDLASVAQGEVGVQIYDYNTYTLVSIICSGPAYASASAVNQGSRNSRVNAVLDPASPDCVSQNVSAPIIIAVSGRADGYYLDSSRGQGTYKEGEGVVKYNQSGEQFSAVFDGTVAELSGFSGRAQTEQRHELQKE